MSLAIIVPTIGRPTLAATLRSIAEQVDAVDRVVVVADGPCQAARDTWGRIVKLGSRCNGWSYHERGPYRDWGHGLRNEALDSIITATHVATIDDDDVYEPGALELMRDACCERPVIFRMRYGRGHEAHGLELWRIPQILGGNVGTPMVVAPVCGARFGSSYTGELDYYRALTAELGEPIWRDEVTVHVRPVPVEEA